MTKGKIIISILILIVVLGGGIGAGLYLNLGNESQDTPRTTQKPLEGDTAQENQAHLPKTPSPLPINYSGSGDSESEVYHLATGSYYFSYSVGVNPSTIQGSGGYGSISINLVNLKGDSFKGIDEYSNGEDGTLRLGETVNKSDGQSSYSKTERVEILEGDYKIEVKSGGVGPRVTDWSVKLYK
jgi:hypothetical protein